MHTEEIQLNCLKKYIKEGEKLKKKKSNPK